MKQISIHYIRLLDAIMEEALDTDSDLHKELKAKNLFNHISGNNEEIILDNGIITGTFEDYFKELENEVNYLSDVVRRMHRLIHRQAEDLDRECFVEDSLYNSDPQYPPLDKRIKDD